jgi:putative phage-type endonuclease
MSTQGTPEWFAERIGKITASRIKDVMAKTKTGPSASRKNYASELALERMSGERKEGFTNGAIQWGIENEPFARAAYELLTRFMVDEVGYIPHPSIERSGASPDGLVGEHGVLEIKCPNTSTHIEWAVAGKVPAEHVLQIQWQLACTGRAWCDFVSFDPRMPEDQQLFIRRLFRDDTLIEEIAKEVSALDREVEAITKSLELVEWINFGE